MSHSQRLSGERAGSNDWNHGADRGVTVRFGACDGKNPNCVPITPGWNYIMRLYHPRAENPRRQLEIPRGAVDKAIDGILEANTSKRRELLSESQRLQLLAVRPAFVNSKSATASRRAIWSSSGRKAQFVNKNDIRFNIPKQRPNRRALDDFGWNKFGIRPPLVL